MRQSGREHILDAHLEEPCDPESELEAGVVLARLDRVHGLARDTEALRQVALGPIPLGTPFPKVVAQGQR